MKLHLGCGQKYLPGYVNIDFPMSHHSVQSKQVADVETDILTLRYPASTIQEIRLHHLFEHFSRTTACALLACWHHWLKSGGLLYLEVPDFGRSSLAFLNPLNSKNKQYTALRHIFGSQEAEWAVHYHGWTKSQLTELLNISGFAVTKTKTSTYKGTFNLEIWAEKQQNLSRNTHRQNIKHYLSRFLIDNSPSESKLLRIWLRQYQSQIDKCW